MAFIWRRVQEVGGVKNAFRTLLKLRDVRAGSLIGTDEFGNKYYENTEYFFGRHRWVFYARRDHDASQVPPEWHSWLHYITDHTPISHPPEPRKFYQTHEENLSGSRHEYVPYSTTQPKIESWQPPTISS